jgi:hypothetical protein
MSPTHIRGLAQKFPTGYTVSMPLDRLDPKEGPWGLRALIPQECVIRLRGLA